MKKIAVLTVIAVLLCVTAVKAQTQPPIPVDYVLKEKTDYARYNQDVINTIDWLQQTAWSEHPELHKQANTFLIAWLTGSPEVSRSLTQRLLS